MADVFPWKSGRDEGVSNLYESAVQSYCRAAHVHWTLNCTRCVAYPNRDKDKSIQVVMWCSHGFTPIHFIYFH